MNDFFPYGTQYYRMPTPLPDEWEQDIINTRKIGLNMIQLRIQWRCNETRKDDYNFSDIDRLIEIANKHKQKIIIKLLLETAPDYIFRDLGGSRIGLDGCEIKAGAHGAFYPGGWLPCFDNPAVMERAIEFSKRVIKRYRNLDNLQHWNIWNEPRSRPIGDCCCSHSVNSYHNYLRKEFGSIDEFNRIYGKSYESFDTVTPPGSAQDYTDLFIWRQWAMKRLTGWLHSIYRVVRAEDVSRPIISHVGCCLMKQDVAGDSSDDYENSRLLDFYGTSYPVGESFQKPSEQAMPFMICDWMRSLSEDFWVYELYPEWGEWLPKIDVRNFRYKVMSALGGGAKGLLFWQYRAERVGMENDLAGLVNIDGSFKAVTFEAERLGKIIKKHATFLSKAKLKTDRVGIIYDLKSDMIGRIETTGPGQWDFALNKQGGLYDYKDNLQGIYSLFHALNLIPKIIDSRNLVAEIADLDIIYLPETYMISKENSRILKDFAASGGRIIAEEGLALRNDNTWLQYPWPGNNFKNIFGAVIAERIVSSNSDNNRLISNDKWQIPAGVVASYLDLEETTETLACWNDKRPAISRRGELFFIGTALGISAKNCEGKEEGIKSHLELLRELLQDRIDLPDYPEGIHVRCLESMGKKLYLIYNQTEYEVVLRIAGKTITVDALDSIFTE